LEGRRGRKKGRKGIGRSASIRLDEDERAHMSFVEVGDTVRPKEGVNDVLLIAKERNRKKGRAK
jgi:hypothetical protein